MGAAKLKWRPRARKRGIVTAATAGVKNSFAPDEPIFSAGDAATCAYLIQSGKVEIRVGTRSCVIDTLETGEIFGEMALVDDHARSASAFAVAPTTCTIITKQQFAKHMERSDPPTRAMLKLMTKRLRKIAHDAHKAAAQASTPDAHAAPAPRRRFRCGDGAAAGIA